MRPKHLAISLSKLAPHPCENVGLEQYATEGDLASYWMLAVDELDGFEEKSVADMGAGNGILGIAALLLGAARVVFVETDPSAITVLEDNIASLHTDLQAKAEVVCATVGVDDVPLDGVDIIVMNPPWGVSEKGPTGPFWKRPFPQKPQRCMSSTATEPHTSNRWQRTTTGGQKRFSERSSDFLRRTNIMPNEKGKPM